MGNGTSPNQKGEHTAMTSILRRVRLILRDWLRALLAPPEDPRQAFVEPASQHRELLARVRRAKENIASSLIQLEAKTTQVRDRLPELEERARQSLTAGREDLARLALQLRHVASEEVQTLDGQILELEQEEQSIALVEERLIAQIGAFEVRQQVVQARHDTAEAQVRVREAMTGVSDDLNGLGAALEQTEQRTESMQAQASAIDELVQLGVLEMPGQTNGNALASALDGAGDANAVEERLAAMKIEVAS